MRKTGWPKRMLLDSAGKRVFACCRKCGRRLAELRGSTTARLVYVDNERVGFENLTTANGRAYRWLCQCGAMPQRSGARLDAEFVAAPPRGKVYLA